MGLVFCTIFHATVTAINLYSIYYDVKFVQFPVSSSNMHHPYGGKFKYYTFLNMILQTFHYIISLILDIFMLSGCTCQSLSSMTNFRDYVFGALAFPCAVNVAFSFWSIFLFDRELVLPKEFDNVMPKWLNLVIHCGIVVFIGIDLCTTFHFYENDLLALLGLTVVLMSYIIWLKKIKKNTGFWVYPVFEQCTAEYRFILISSLYVCTLCYYFIGKYISNWAWGYKGSDTLEKWGNNFWELLLETHKIMRSR